MAAVLVKDIQTGSPDSLPAQFANLNNAFIFAADDGLNGREVWKSDGVAGGGGTFLLKDIYTGTTPIGSPSVDVPNSSSPENFTVVGGNVYFTATNAANGLELWKSDGTTAGTSLVKDIASGTTGANPTGLTAVGGTLFFAASDGSNGFELWKTDGTTAGTVMVKNIASGGSSSNPTQLTNVGGVLYFAADDGVNGTEIWKSDGTTAGTNIVTNVRLGAAGSNPTSLTNVAGTLFFAANDGGNGVELWKSDGTASGTVLVKNINLGAPDSSPGNFLAIGSTLYFTANDGSNGVELWKSDGTAAGTTMVSNINVSAGSGSDPASLVNVDGVLFFRANDGVTGAELWKSNGTSAGTTRVADIRAGALGSDPSQLKAGNGLLYFTADDGTNGVELWTSDGTGGGTAIDTDIRSGSAGSNPIGLTTSIGKVIFSANDGTHGTELFSATLPNAKPVALADAYTFDAGAARVVSAPGVLANDTDLEGSALSTVLVATPTNGTVTLNADGSFTYTPNAGFDGRDTFTYRAFDGTDQSVVAATVTMSSRNYAYVESLYVKLLGRATTAVTSAEVDFWVGRIGAGASRTAVAHAITQTDEYRVKLISDYYQRFLRRSAGLADLSGWLGALQNGMTANALLANILASQEYFARGTTDRGFVTNLYADLLGRAPTVTEAGYWTQALGSGFPRLGVTTAFIASDEYRVVLIGQLYTNLLHRSADAGGLSFWLTQVRSGATLQDISATLLGSAEYFASL